MSSTLLLPGQKIPLSDALSVDEAIGKHIDLIVDGGATGIEPTTVIDLSSGSVEVLRRGLGDISSLI